jgi:hypothetical protein
MTQKALWLVAVSGALLALVASACTPSRPKPESFTATPPLPQATPFGMWGRIWRGGNLIGDHVKTTLPFELKGDNHIFVRLSLGGLTEPQEYLLDTGSPVTVFSPATAAQLGLRFETQIGKYEVAFANMKIGEADFANIGVLVSDVYTANLTNPLSCELQNGIIGQNLFRHAIWQFDFRQKTITLTHHLDELSQVQGAQQLELIESSQFVYGPHHFIKVKLGEVEMLGMIDIGRPTVEIKQAEFVAGGNRAPEIGGSRYVETRLRQLQVGNLTLTNLPVTVKTTDFVIPRGPRTPWFFIGNSFLSNFVVTLDYPHQSLYLLPYSVNPAEIVWPTPASYGFLTFYGDGNQLIVYRVTRPSAAAKAGLREGDRILTLNDEDFSTTTHAQACALWLTGLDNRYSGPLIVAVERAEQILSFEIDKAPATQ